ncbi:DUF935 domain-containing protein [Roseateles sp. DXS20W]|uniref:DUF935 domain-containing protein n=1 Tax=Pelomonas lactea TaxID=3299030 RepID=A0ABW7GK20_9BURK
MAEIVDQNGQPLRQEIASIERDPHRVFFGGIQYNEDDTLKSRGGSKGLKIYQELKRDAHAGAVLAKRKRAVTGRPWVVEPASEAPADVAAADLVREYFESIQFNQLCKRLLEATLQGFAVVEAIWEVVDGKLLPTKLKARNARRFTFDVNDEMRLLTREAPLLGEPLPPRKFIIHRRGADTEDSPYGEGVGAMLFWPVFFKRNGITFWLTFADKFGAPTALGKYPPNAQQADQKKLLAALKAISRDAGVIIPDGMAVEFLEAQRSGSVDTYEKLVRYMDELISKAVLGETMSTTASSAGLGSGQANVQDDVRMEVAKDDADELDETLTEFARWIVELNIAGAKPPRVRRVFDEPEDTVKLATRDKLLTEMGFEPDEAYIQQTYGNGWKKKAPAPMPPALASMPPGGAVDETDQADFAEGAPPQAAGSQRAFNRARQEAILAASEELAGQWKELMGKPVERLTAMLEESGDLVAFREGLARLLDDKPDPTTVETIARATFAGHLMGRGLARKKPGLLGKWKQRLLG